MEEVQTRFREGVISHLEQLESLSHNLSVKQELKKREHENLDVMRETVLKLRIQRDELRAKVALQKEQQGTSIDGYITQRADLEETKRETNHLDASLQALSVDQEAPSGPGHTGEDMQEVALEVRLAEMKRMLEAYWLTGISGKLTRKGVCICISTAFEGTYLDAYHVDLVLQQNPRIVRHSVPAFIPLEQLAKTHLQKDLKKFLLVLFEHLNAYAGRKYQADQLQDHPETFVCGTLQINSLCTMITFQYNLKLDGSIVTFSAKLLYDVTCCLPTEAVITCTECTPSLPDRVTSHSTLFRQQPLHKALEFFRLEEETLNRTHSSLAD